MQAKKGPIFYLGPVLAYPNFLHFFTSVNSFAKS